MPRTHCVPRSVVLLRCDWRSREENRRCTIRERQPTSSNPIHLDIDTSPFFLSPDFSPLISLTRLLSYSLISHFIYPVSSTHTSLSRCPSVERGSVSRRLGTDVTPHPTGELHQHGQLLHRHRVRQGRGGEERRIEEYGKERNRVE